MLQKLREKIESTDQLLSEASEKNNTEEIDIDQEDWLEIAQMQSDSFREEYSEMVNRLTKEIFDYLNLLNDQDRRALIEDIRSTEYLKNSMTLTEEHDTIENKILLFIITSSKIDTRDALLELNDLIELAKQKGVNYKAIIENLLPFSDDTKTSEMGSMRQILARII